MGMDVFDVRGRNGAERASEAYFHANLFWWPGIAAFGAEVAPDLWGKIEYPDTNDGDGLDADDAHALAAAITTALDSGRAAAWVDQWEAARAAVPRVECRICLGTGVRTPEDDLRLLGFPLPGHSQPTTCNGCLGVGTVPGGHARCPASVPFIEQWRDFLLAVTSRFAIC